MNKLQNKPTALQTLRITVCGRRSYEIDRGVTPLPHCQALEIIAAVSISPLGRKYRSMFLADLCD
jgi:hypothetical protein